jgi:hypothetical protein
MLVFLVTDHIFGRRADVTFPRSESFGPHGHRTDFCQSAEIDRFAINKSILRFTEQLTKDRDEVKRREM